MSDRPGLNKKNILCAFEAWSGWSIVGKNVQKRIEIIIANLTPEKLLSEIKDNHAIKERDGVPAVARPLAEVIQVEEIMAVMLRALQLRKALEDESEELLEELFYRLCAAALGKESCEFIPREELMHEVAIPASPSMLIDAAPETASLTTEEQTQEAFDRR